MGKIIILDENTSNRIAAGEVIERPASVVKELVENSIDAGSDNIIIEIKNGGISYIRVTDNGSGISEDDTEIAFERHSTSKIRSPEDLDSICTLGFRGEALASIAAVSKVQLVTKTEGSPYGMSLEISGGQVIGVRQVGCPVGTSLTVRDLFFNTPARFKFLKKDATEARYVSDIITRIALGHPQISFKLISNGSDIIHTPGNNDLLSVIFSIYGRKTAREVCEINYTDNGIKITGFAGKPEIAWSNRSRQSIYVNGRYIKSKVVSSAIDEAYKTLLLKNRYAFIVLKIEINSLFVDVNVHPAKMDVRFSDEQGLYRCVYDAISNALLSKPGIRTFRAFEEVPQKFVFKQSESPAVEYTQQKMPVDNRFAGEKPPEPPCVKDNIHKPKAEDNLSVSQENILSEAKIVGQLFSTYVLLQFNDRILLIDQHAAHERITYEALKRKFEAEESLSQVLISPVVVELTPDEIRLVEDNADFLNRIGYTIESFGNNSIILRSVPYISNNDEIRELFLEIINKLTCLGRKDFGPIAGDTLYIIACKAAVKANRKLDNLEIRNMLKELEKIKNPYTCPHGRPTIIEITKYEMEKMFKRIV
jgi:DNA mismatch repair protein MutL